MISETPAANDASAMALPWKISTSALALSQTIEDESVSRPTPTCARFQQTVGHGKDRISSFDGWSKRRGIVHVCLCGISQVSRSVELINSALMAYFDHLHSTLPKVDCFWLGSISGDSSQTKLLRKGLVLKNIVDQRAALLAGRSEYNKYLAHVGLFRFEVDVRIKIVG